MSWSQAPGPQKSKIYQSFGAVNPPCSMTLEKRQINTYSCTCCTDWVLGIQSSSLNEARWNSKSTKKNNTFPKLRWHLERPWVCKEDTFMLEVSLPLVNIGIDSRFFNFLGWLIAICHNQPPQTEIPRQKRLAVCGLPAKNVDWKQAK